MLVHHDSRRIAEAFQDVEIGFRIAFHFVFRSEQKDKRKTSLLNQLPRDDESITAVVAFAAEDRDGPLIEIFELILENFGHTHAGVLHQDKTWDSIFFGGKAIDFAELFWREDSHIGG